MTFQSVTSDTGMNFKNSASGFQPLHDVFKYLSQWVMKKTLSNFYEIPVTIGYTIRFILIASYLIELIHKNFATTGKEG